MESLKLFLGLLGAIISLTRLEYFVTPLKVAASPIVTAQKNVTPTKVKLRLLKPQILQTYLSKEIHSLMLVTIVARLLFILVRSIKIQA